MPENNKIIKNLLDELEQSYTELEILFNTKQGQENRKLLIELPKVNEAGRRLWDRLKFYKTERINHLLSSMKDKESLMELADSPLADEYIELQKIPNFLNHNEVIRASYMKEILELINTLIYMADTLEDYVITVQEQGIEVKEVNTQNREEIREKIQQKICNMAPEMARPASFPVLSGDYGMGGFVLVWYKLLEK